ncbi:MAG: transglutaminase domain-containing protein [Deltaproteobacteria bacterium]|nr:transglutaminase domain-containing protein [Deltaproteobacteria bacterium]
MKIKYTTIILTAILLFISHWNLVPAEGSDKKQYDSSYTIPRNIRMSFTIKNPTGELIKDTEFWTYAPVNKTSTQEVININSSHEYRLENDAMGDQIMFFNFPTIPPFTVKIIDIDVTLMLSESPQKISIDNQDNYLKPEKYCESDDPSIISLAESLKTKNAFESATNIYKWVSGNIAYSGYIKNMRGALYALENRKGDCTEYACLFTAFCRANHIASRTVGGFICNKDSILKPGEYHNWAEFYDDGYWKLSDTQKKVFVKNQADYIVFKILGESEHNIFKNENGLFGCSSEGVEVKMNG